MTHRTEPTPETAVERATAEILRHIRWAAANAYKSSNVAALQRIPEAEFLRIVALHLHDKSLTEWCRVFVIPDASDREDHAPEKGAGI
jgi:hypothetical protein